MANFITHQHLGGYEDGIHSATYFPILWHYIVKKYQIKSVLDVGCGQGHSTKFFKDLGCSVLGIDGLKDPNRVIYGTEFILHDYEYGSVFGPNTNQVGPNLTFDLCWSCEFVEHVSEKYMHHFLQDFAQCKYIVLTHATPGQALRDQAHHHVNEQPSEYWIDVIQNLGYEYLDLDTLMLRAVADADAHTRTDNDYFNHFIYKGLMFAKR